MQENKKIKITYILSDIDRAVAFEWITELLDRNRFDLSFILLNSSNSFIEEYLINKNVPIKRIRFNGMKDAMLAIIRIFFFLQKNQINIVHCHLFPAAFCGLMASKLAGIKRRIYTRHYSVYHHKYVPRFVKFDTFLNKLATDIIAISNVVKNTLINLEKVKRNKIHLVYHGFKLELFEHANIPSSRIFDLKLKYNPLHKSPVVGVSARFMHLKGIQYIIPAFKKLLASNPNALLILANANGNYKNEIRELLKEIPTESYLEIKFENDLFALFHLFDVFLHVPIDAESEAFGQIYVEALAAGIPSVFTLSGIATEFIVHQKNALVVPYRDSEAIYEAAKKIVSEPGLYNSMIEQGKKDVKELFSINRMMEQLTKIYET